MYRLVRYLSLAAVLFAASCSGPSPSARNLSPEAFRSRLENKALLVDVRTPEEYNQGHLAAATLINWEDAGFEEAVKAKIPKDAEVILYCRSGRRSAAAAERMKEMGYNNVAHLHGGIKAWEAAQYPIEK